MKAILFETKNAQRIYDNYISRSQKVIKVLSEEDKEDCLLEINSYIYEFLDKHKTTSETDSLLDILDRLGAPEDTLQKVVAAKKTSQAIRTFHPAHIIQAVFLNIRSGIMYSFLFVLLLFLLSFPVLIILKLIYPADVGCFAGSRTFRFGFVANTENTHEILGNWFIPVVILVSVILYFSIIFLLKLHTRIKRNTTIKSFNSGLSVAYQK